MRKILLLQILFISLLTGWSYSAPKMICYSAQPNAYFSDHARDVAKIYDGFYFTIGTWDAGVLQSLGASGVAPENPKWRQMARPNLFALKKAGVTENFLTVCFGQDDEWPSPTLLFSREYTVKMAAHFAAIGQAAKELGFRGVCIDTEYPYPRYELDHEIYRYENYSADDLLAAAKNQGRATMAALLEQFPEAVILNLPGSFRTRPIERAYLLGLITEMIERNAPGGFHLGTEYTYCMHDPVTVLATTRSEDTGMRTFLDPAGVAYWQEKCSMAPGVWPLHIFETGGKNYPVQPWKQEIQELAQELAILRTTAKHYIWSYSGSPVWYLYSKNIEKKYGLTAPNLSGTDVDIRDWHQVLQDKAPLTDPGLLKLAGKINNYDEGILTDNQLCDAFGTPSSWWVLGMLGNFHSRPEFAAKGAIFEPIDLQKTWFGRDGVVRWFPYENLDLRGTTLLLHTFDWQHTDSASAQLVSFVHSASPREARLHVGWDDGIIIYLNHEIIFDRRDYPKLGKGMLFKDRYQFEEQVPFSLPAGTSRLAVFSINSHGNWIFSLRITDPQGLPFDDVAFRLE